LTFELLLILFLYLFLFHGSLHSTLSFRVRKIGGGSIALLKTLQDDPFAGLVRVIVSTRRFHFEDKLGQLRGLIVAPTVVQVGVYDDTPGGELDQRLALEGLIRADLHPDLIELARTPRLFDLVVRLKDRLVGSGANLKRPAHSRNARDDGTDLGTRSLQGAAL
jgi:hypothetical protein